MVPIRKRWLKRNFVGSNAYCKEFKMIFYFKSAQNNTFFRRLLNPITIIISIKIMWIQVSISDSWFVMWFKRWIQYWSLVSLFHIVWKTMCSKIVTHVDGTEVQEEGRMKDDWWSGVIITRLLLFVNKKKRRRLKVSFNNFSAFINCLIGLL